MLSESEAHDAQRVREYTAKLIHEAADAEEPVLVEAPPNSGKSTSARELAEIAETPITYLAGRTDIYDEAVEWAEDKPGITATVIPSPFRDCPTFMDENSGETAKAHQLYSKGVPGPAIHYEKGVYTPCHVAGEDECPYIEAWEELSKNLGSGEIRLLIGNHQHAQNTAYIEDRIVVLDEFNADPFVRSFPSEEDLAASDHPGHLVGNFLSAIDDDSFPNEAYNDVTDILRGRDNQDSLDTALRWFEENGATKDDVESYEFYDVSEYKYDSSHRLAALLTLSYLCMRKVGEGIECAPPPESYDLPRVREAWRHSGLENIRCVRDRNTGEVTVLRPPDLSSAKQVIGLDGLPSKQLWNLVFGSNFDHRRVISRDDFTKFLSSALDMSFKQIGDGKYPYAGARISSKDKYRFAVIKSLEERPFALISTKKALEEYESRGWIEPFVKSAPEEMDDENEALAMMNYATVLSSNKFKKEDLGVVSGSPFPGYDVLRQWAGLCGTSVEIPDQEKELSLDGAAEELYHHFSHHQVIQAVLRFGRDRSVWNRGGSTVWLNTTALPEWFDVERNLSVEGDTKRTAVISYLIRAKRADDEDMLSEQNTRSISENIDADIRDDYIPNILSDLRKEGLVETSDRGWGGRLHCWDGDEQLIKLDGLGMTHALRVGDEFFVLDV